MISFPVFVSILGRDLLLLTVKDILIINGVFVRNGSEQSTKQEELMTKFMK
jgi:hypothetical protein